MIIDESLYDTIKLYYECIQNIKFNDINGYREYINNELADDALKYIISIILLCESTEEDVSKN